MQYYSAIWKEKKKSAVPHFVHSHFINDPNRHVLRAEGLPNVDETIQGGFAD